MTQEDKAKAYDNIIEKANKMYIENCEACQMCIEELLPELQESEGERIRKDIIVLVKDWWDRVNKDNISTKEQMLTWLEKQGEQKPADKVESKFKVGDFIANDYCVGKVIALTDDAYLLDTGQGIPFSCEHNAHLWTIQDAKDGDVLATEPIERYHSPFVAIYKKQNEEDFDSYCFIGFDGKFYKGKNGHSTEEVHPATKEQRDTLEKAMADAGYTFDFKKKELKKIEQKSVKFKPLFRVGDVIKPKDPVLGEPRIIKGIHPKFGYDTNNGILNFEFEDNWELVEQNLDWSEEDKRIIDNLISQLGNLFARKLIKEETKDKYVNFLKSLKDRYTWKPSDEHYELEEFAKIVRDNLMGISRVVIERLEAKYLQLTGNKMYNGFID